MKASDFNRLIQNNCAAAIESVAKGEIGFETVIGVLECHKQALIDWRKAVMTQPMILPAKEVPKIG